MTRAEAFQELKAHPWHKRTFAKLSSEELGLCLSFLEENAALPREEFEKAVNRMFLDSVVKPKRWTMVLELLSLSNTRAG